MWLSGSTGIASEAWPANLVTLARGQGLGGAALKTIGYSLEELSEVLLVEPYEARTSDKRRHIGIFMRDEDTEGQKLVEVKLYGFVKEINLGSGGDWRGCVTRCGGQRMQKSYGV